MHLCVTSKPLLLLALGVLGECTGLSPASASFLKRSSGVRTLVAIAPECKKYVKANSNPEQQMKAQNCEQQGGYAEEAVSKLQAGDSHAAEKVVADSFEKCAGFSKECAETLAPRVVQKMRFAGLAVTNECGKEMKQVQEDQMRMKEVAKCEREADLAGKMLDKLNGSDLDGAMKVAEEGLEQCIGFTTKGCEAQLAPVVVNQLVQHVMAPQTKIVPIFLNSSPQKVANLSLLKVALFDQPPSKKAAALLETNSKVGSYAARVAESTPFWVSKLLLSLSEK